MIHNEMSKVILKDASDGTRHGETVRLSKWVEPQEGNMTHATPDMSLSQLTPQREWILPSSSTSEPCICDPVLPRALQP